MTDTTASGIPSTENSESPPKKLLIVTTVPQTLEAFLLPYAEHYREKGWTVDALSQGASSSDAVVAAFNSAFDVEWSRNPVQALVQLNSLARRIREIVAVGTYDIVHVHTPVASFVTRYALKDLRGRGGPSVVYTAHGFHFHAGGGRLRNAAFVALERLAGRWTDHLVLINQEDVAQAHAFGIVPPDRIHPMPGIGVDIDEYVARAEVSGGWEGVRQEMGVDAGTPVVLMIAEFIERKRHADAIHAVATCDRTDLHLALAGTGPVFDEMSELAADLGVRDRVHFLGFRRDIPALLAAADLCLLPSEHEGLPRSVMEAMAVGVPVIGTDIRGVRDLLEGGAGVLVPVGDPGAIAAAFERLLAEPLTASDISRAARERVARYDIHRLLDMHDELYSSCDNI